MITKTKNKVFKFVFLVFCFLLTSCDPPRFYHDNVTDKVVEIELIEYNENKVANRKKIDEFNFEKEKKLKTLNEYEQNDFLADITDIYIVRYFIPLTSISGRCIKMIFDDNTFEVISENQLVVHYSETGAVLEYIGFADDNRKLQSLINKYFTFQE